MPLEQERFEAMVAHAKAWVEGNTLKDLPLEKRILHTCAESANQRTITLTINLQSMAKGGPCLPPGSLASIALETMFYQTAIEYLITGERHNQSHFSYLRVGTSLSPGFKNGYQVDDFLEALGYRAHQKI